MTIKGQLRNAYPAMRIFIFGEEVTEDVMSCTVNWSDDDRAPSTAEFTLANPFDRYTLTKSDIGVLYPSIDITTLKLTELQQLAVTDMDAARQFALQTAYEEFLPGGVGPLTESDTAVVEGVTNTLVFEARQEGYPRAQENEATLTTAINNIEHKIRQNIKTIGSSEDERGRIGPRTGDSAKRRVLRAKFGAKQQVSQPSLNETGRTELAGPRRLNYLQGYAYTYNFVCSAPIFHSNDPVRIFWRDPFDMNKWFFMHTGFLTDWTRSVTADNVNTLTIRSEDVLRAFRYARITTNPGVFDISRLQQQEDLVFRSFFNEAFTGLTVPEIIYTMVFGPNAAGTTATLVRNQEEQFRFATADEVSVERRSAGGVQIAGTDTPMLAAKRSRFGVGAFNFDRSATFIIGNKTTAPEGEDSAVVSSDVAAREVRLIGPNALGVYQGLVDHQVYASDINNLIAEEARTNADIQAQLQETLKTDASGQYTTESVVTTIGRNPHIFPVDGGRLFMLLPASLGDKVSRRAILRDFVQSVATQTTFKVRLSVMYDILERIEFSLYATPKGDLVVEMPLYDFEPRDWGEQPISEAEAQSLVFQARTQVSEALIGPSLSSQLRQPTSTNLQASGSVGPISTGLSLNILSDSSQIELQGLIGDLGGSGPPLRSKVQAAAISNRIQQIAGGSALGPFATRYRVTIDNTISTQQTFSDEHVRTQMRAGFNLLAGYKGTGTTDAMGGDLIAVETLQALIPQFGVRIESVSDDTIVNSAEAAKLYCALQLNQWNAEAVTSAIDMIPRLELGPNRPLQVAEGEYVATIRSISHTLDWAGRDMSSNVGVNYTRQWDGQQRVDDAGVKTPRFAPMGGYASRSLNYAVALGFDDPDESTQARDAVDDATIGEGAP